MFVFVFLGVRIILRFQWTWCCEVVIVQCFFRVKSPFYKITVLIWEGIVYAAMSLFPLLSRANLELLQSPAFAILYSHCLFSLLLGILLLMPADSRADITLFGWSTLSMRQYFGSLEIKSSACNEHSKKQTLSRHSLHHSPSEVEDDLMTSSSAWKLSAM